MLKTSPSTTRVTGKNSLPFNPVGAELVTMPYAFYWDVNKVASVSGDTMILQSAMTDNSGSVYCFIQNSISVLTRQNDWAFNSDLKKLYIKSSSDPSGLKYSTIDTLVKVHSVNYVTFDSLAFEGANKACISADTLNNIVIKNCTFINSYNGIVLNRAIRDTVKNCHISNMLNDGVFTQQFSDTLIVIDNTVRKCGLYPGMGANGNDAYLGIFSASFGAKIERNNIDSIGFNGISYFGNPYIHNNYLNYTCLRKSDAGGIYTCGVGLNSGSIIRSNIVRNTIGYFFQPQDRISSAIYLDCNSNGVIIDSNTIEKSKDASIILNLARNVLVRYNTVVDSFGVCIYTPSGYAYQNVVVTNNVFYQKNKSLPIVRTNYYLLDGCAEDTNYLLRPDSTINQFRQANTYYSIAAWIVTTGLDSHSTFAPSGITAAPGRLIYNNTSTAQMTSLDGLYIDAQGNQYNNSITMQPFEQGKVLFKADHELNYRKKYGRYKFR